MLRRRLVDGNSVGRLSAGEAARKGRTHIAGALCQFSDSARSKTNAEAAHHRSRLAIRRRTEIGRGHASADDPGHGFVWSGVTAAGWRPDSLSGAVEVRIQKHQVDRKDWTGGGRAAHDLEHRGAFGIWLLLQRESPGRSSALESGNRAPHRRVRWPPDADV